MKPKHNVPAILTCIFFVFAGILSTHASTPASNPTLWLRSDEGVQIMPSMQTGMDTVVFWNDYLSPWRGAEATGYWKMGEDSGFTVIHNGLNGSPSLRYEPMWSNDPGLKIFSNCIDSGASSAEYFVLLKSDPWAFGVPLSLGHSWGLEYSGQSFIRDSFGRGYDSVDMDSMSIGLPLDDWRIYHAAATASEWFARLDGNTLVQTPAMPFQVYPWNGGIGIYHGWSGEIAEIIVYSRTLTEGERQQTTDYLRARRGGSIGAVTPPSSLSTSAIDYNYATLQWSASATPGVWYEIERRTGTSGAWTLICSTSTGQTSHTNYNLSPSTTYQYRIRAVKNGIRSDYGSTLTVTTPAGTPPAPPANLTVTYVGADPETGSPLVRLEWTPPNPTPDNYLLYVKNGDNNQFFGAQYISGRDTFHVTTRAFWGAPNYYKLTSLRHPLESEFSDQAMIVIKPQKPSGPVANNLSDTSIRLMWFDTGWAGNTFELQRKPASAGDGAWETIYTVVDPADINGNGVIYHTDTGLLPGTAYNYRLRTHNSGGSSDYSHYTHTTTGEPPDDGEPPVAISQTIALFQDTPQTITLQGYSPEGNLLTYAIVANPANGTLSGTPPSLTYTPDANYTGGDSFTFKINDGGMDSAPATVSLDIYPPDADSTTRRLVITSPADNATLLTRTEIKGSALDPDFDRYELQYRPVAAAGSAPASWTTFARDIRRVGVGGTPGTLGHLEPGMMRNGVYELRILLHTASGSPATRESASVKIVIEGQRKIGPFTISFKDYSGSASGVPIEVVRTYDSRDRDIDGDFGHGWNLAVNTITLRKNRSIATGWEQVRAGLYVPTYSLQKQPGARHLIALQFPDGSTSTFEVNAACSYNYPLYNNPSRTTPVFQPAGNRSKGTLAIAAAPTSFYVSATPDQEDNGPVTLSTQSYAYYNAYQFNPTRFTYTDVAGNKYTIDEKLGLIDQTTPQGQKITFNRDAQGRVTGYTHSNGTSLTIHRDPVTHRITGITTPEGDTIAYTCDANGDLAGHTDRAGATTSFTYYTDSPDPRDAHLAHFLKEIIDPNNTPAIRNEYDEQGRLIRQTDALGNPVEYTHNTEAATEIVTDRLGYTTAHAYDDEGNITRTVQADGSEINYAFGDPFNPNAVTQKTDALGRVTTYEYDSAGRVKKEINDLGEFTETVYNAQGNPTQSKDARGNITKTDYLGNGLPSKLTDAEGNATTFNSYDARGNLTQFTDAAGRATQVTYTAADKILTQTSPDGILTTFEYDAHGHVSKQTRVKNGLTEITGYINDPEGRVLQTTHPDGTITTTQYNPNGKPVLVTDAAGRATATEYDAAGNVIKSPPRPRPRPTASNPLSPKPSTTPKAVPPTKKTPPASGRAPTTTRWDAPSPPITSAPASHAPKPPPPPSATANRSVSPATTPRARSPTPTTRSATAPITPTTAPDAARPSRLRASRPRSSRSTPRAMPSTSPPTARSTPPASPPTPTTPTATSSSSPTPTATPRPTPTTKTTAAPAPPITTARSPKPNTTSLAAAKK
ncbi:fibronectin type III domain-containing protein [Ereboglobus luteus]|uniref:Fibronectin type-III domain-containing protein n=1 Tax=Ereboglobus luteus TaxID=1796921 RepID=A0A2U8DZR8_9BACT|nr:hypothetical protein CKA38_01355 [Ereboglobus luteus]